MLKKIICLFVLSIIVLSTTTFAETITTTKDWKKSTPIVTKDYFEGTFGWGITPVWGGVSYDSNNYVIGTSGINAFLGWTFKNFNEPMKLNSFNTYWHWGTILVAIPYVGIGGEYVTEGGFYIGINTLYILPTAYIGIYF